MEYAPLSSAQTGNQVASEPQGSEYFSGHQQQDHWQQQQQQQFRGVSTSSAAPNSSQARTAHHAHSRSVQQQQQNNQQHQDNNGFLRPANPRSGTSQTSGVSSDESLLGGGGAGARSAASSTKPPSYRQVAAKKPKGHRDIIDQLDITSPFVTNALHHDGPFDAASSHRNRAGATARPAPMAAFRDPAGATEDNNAPFRRLQQQPSARPYLSARATSALSATLDDNNKDAKGGSVSQLNVPTLSSLANDPAVTGSDPTAATSSRRRRNSTTSVNSVHMGYPLPYLGENVSNKSEERLAASRAKAMAYAETFGLTDREAWEDYGRSSFAREDPRDSTYDIAGASGSSSTGNEQNGASGLSRPKPFSRAERTASVWDMEATLRAGVPVGSAPPPMPVLPPEFSNPASGGLDASSPNLSASGSSSGTGGGPKRSKSLMQRIRRNKNDPSDDGVGRKPSLRVTPAAASTSSSPQQQQHSGYSLSDPPVDRSPRSSPLNRSWDTKDAPAGSSPQQQNHSTALGPSFDEAFRNAESEANARDESVLYDMLQDASLENGASAENGPPTPPKDKKPSRSTSLMRRITRKR